MRYSSSTVAILELHRHVNERRDVGLVQINLLQQRREEFRRIELALIFPEELAPIDDVAAPQVEQVHRDQRRLGVVGEDVGVVAFGRGHLLLFAHFLDGVQQIVQRGGFFVAHGLAGGFDARSQLLFEILVAAFEEQADIAHGLGVAFVA